MPIPLFPGNKSFYNTSRKSEGAGREKDWMDRNRGHGQIDVRTHHVCRVPYECIYKNKRKS